MTYTFKLARRLAVSRNFRMLPALLLFAACSGEDATSPNGSPPELTPVAVRINPGKVTLATNQLIRFRARGLTSSGDSVAAAVTWTTTGGTILPDGLFSAGTIGTFDVIGVNRSREDIQVDTAKVTVVRRQLLLKSVEITPGSTTLTPGTTQTFTAIGRNLADRAVPIGVTWTATGGDIDGGGTYTAGDSGGTYQVIAVNIGGTVADTATVTINAPPPPPPAPVLGQVTLVPSTATLAPATTRQFKAYGRTTAGDSVAVSVVFVANGGTVSSEGLYTAGPTAGTFRVIASDGGLADTSVVTVTAPLGSGPASGVPFGLFDGPANAPFTMTYEATSASTIVARIAQVRSQGNKIMIALAGGAHSHYLTAGKFDLAKWQAKIDTYRTPEIQAAIAEGVAYGTILGHALIDEPNHASWGGVLTKAMVDGMGSYSKSLFPTLPVGYGIGPRGYLWRPTERFQVIDFIANQYNWWISDGDVVAWREKVLAQAKLDGVAVQFGLNVLDGGVHVFDGGWTCPLTTTGGQGTYSPACRMTARQISEWGRALAPYACGFQFWRYDSGFFAKAENQQAFRDVAGVLAATPARGCRRQ